MKKKNLLLVLSVLAINLVAASVYSGTPPATEVERVKDKYYFKIHGQPLTGSQPTLAEVVFIYKNLDSTDQEVNIIIEKTVEPPPTPPSYGYEFPSTVGSGGEWTGAPAQQLLGTEVWFELWIDDDMVFDGTIWVPHN